jgi:hypothetical protein
VGVATTATTAYYVIKTARMFVKVPMAPSELAQSI